MMIRKAKLEDLSRLKTLLEQLGYNHSIEWINNKLETYLNSKSYQILVAEDEGIIIGFITLILYESFVFDKTMHIESLIIDANLRGKGTGAKLMAEAEIFAKENGCNLIELLTLNRRRKEGTHNFYEKLGFKDQNEADLTYFSKILASTH